MTSSVRQARPPQPTLEMVAEVAGVSRATVSRVVNGSTKVRPGIVASVTAAIDELNYVPNRAARSLASRQTQALALVVPEDMTRFFGDPYFAAVVQGITRRLDQSDYTLNLLVASSDPLHKTLRYLRSGNVDGALIISHHTGDDFVAELQATMPVVFGGRPSAADDLEAYFVDVDNAAGAERGTQRLIDIGRRRIGSISGAIDMPAGIDRVTGFQRTLDRVGMPTDAVEYADFTVVGAAAATRRLLERCPDIDGIFVASDLMATGAVAVLQELGRSVPGDIAIVGFDDSPAATSGPIPLTTVHQPSNEMGYAMADTLLRRLAGDEQVPHRTIMPTHLVLRDSA
ncbi:LacI family DNA-binding transcriptional regulator [Cryobacterium sp. PH31-AA6]|uniref:LacI family DNA-binding transcriptional regulator n=1 Tax=Cryobacterium sp. PH31-AA6 TaxID=3046205 RepID=UPI0024BB6ABA|nr:LacI family DNA-binding transcriptional regulator [Cryobacterium sp. PH31-AA6]MDJ0323369.1 LacI family DNA-binding transcriptional regulator [Cryobacterium sp. PH31-AA6]